MRISHAHQIYNKSAAIENPKTTSFVKLSLGLSTGRRVLRREPQNPSFYFCRPRLRGGCDRGQLRGSCERGCEARTGLQGCARDREILLFLFRTTASREERTRFSPLIAKANLCKGIYRQYGRQNNQKTGCKR